MLCSYGPSCALTAPLACAGGEEAAALQGEVDALVKQLADEADLVSATLDRAEAAEREMAALRAQLDERETVLSLLTMSHMTVSHSTSQHDVLKLLQSSQSFKR